MQLSHSIKPNSSVETNTFDDLIKGVKAAQLEARAGADFNQLETQVAQLFNQAQREILTTILEEYDIDVPQFECDGHIYKQAIRNTKRYMTAAGEVTVARNLYRNKRNGETYCPIELRSGIIEDFFGRPKRPNRQYTPCHWSPRQRLSVYLKHWVAWLHLEVA